MEQEKIAYFVHESIVARQERTIKRLWILCIIIFAALIATNGLWIWYESQWEVVETHEVTQEIDTGNGDATAVGIGDYYGTYQADGNGDENESEKERGDVDDADVPEV